MASFPEPHALDTDTVMIALEVGRALWARNDRRDALKWLRKAVDDAFEAGLDARALELSKTAAALAPAPSAAPPPAVDPIAAIEASFEAEFTPAPAPQATRPPPRTVLRAPTGPAPRGTVAESKRSLVPAPPSPLTAVSSSSVAALGAVPRASTFPAPITRAMPRVAETPQGIADVAERLRGAFQEAFPDASAVEIQTMVEERTTEWSTSRAAQTGEHPRAPTPMRNNANAWASATTLRVALRRSGDMASVRRLGEGETAATGELEVMMLAPGCDDALMLLLAPPVPREAAG
jgi:hypothetical protein